MDNLTFSMVMLAAVMHASWNFFTKKTKKDRFSLLWIAHLYIMLFSLPLMPYALFQNVINKEIMFYIIATGVFHALYILILGWAYKVGEISFIYPISRGLSIIGASFCGYILNIDSLSYLGILGVCVIALGVIIAGNSQYKITNKSAIIASILLGGMTAIYSTIDKLAVVYMDSWSYCSITFFSTGCILSIYVLTLRRDMIKDVKYSYFRDGGFLGATMFITYGIVLYAFQKAPVAYVVALREVSVAVASALGIIILNESKSLKKIIGIAILLMGAIIIKLV